MKSKHSSIYLFIVSVTTMLISSCTLFIDDNLVGLDLPEYHGNGYDAPTHEKGENYDVTYQYQPSTKVLTNAEQVKHVRHYFSDKNDFIHIVFFDKDTPEEDLPKVGQPIISTNAEKFPKGLFDIVQKCTKLKNGYAVISRHAQPREIFKELELNAKAPLYFQDYDFLDEDSVEHHVHISDDGTTATIDGENHNANGMHKIKRVDIPFGIPFGSVYLPLSLSWNPKNNPNHPFEASFSGSVMLGVTCNIHISVLDGCDLSIEAGVWLDAEGEVKVHTPTKPRLWKSFRKDFLIMAGPVPLFPKIAFRIYTQFEAKAYAKIGYHLQQSITLAGGESSDGEGDGGTKESEFTFEAGLEGSVQIPKITATLGVGVGTPLAGVYADFSTALVGSVSLIADFKKDFYDTSEEEYLNPAEFYDVLMDDNLHLQMNPMLKLSQDTEWGLQVGVDGQSMEQLDQYKDKLDDAMNKVGDIIEDINDDIEDLDDDMIYDVDNDDREAFNEDLNKQLELIEKSKEYEEIIKAYQAQENAIEQNKEQIEEAGNQMAEKTGLIQKEFGPWKINSLCFDWITKSIWPKMNDSSFRVGRKYNSDQSGLIFTPEYTLEDPGLLSEFKTYYPGFVVKQGSTTLGFYPCDKGQVINSDTERGARFTALLPGLSPNTSYTCIPAYATSGNGDPTIFNKGISFSTTTPSVSIMDLVLDKVEVYEDQSQSSGASSGAAIYEGTFKTYSMVNGSRNVREWGILDNNDKNENTKYHKDKTASKGAGGTMQTGYYTHWWKVKTKKGKINISLTPYAIAKDDKVTDNASGVDYRKYFSTWEQTLNLRDYVSSSSSGANDGSWDDEYELELISEEFTPIEE